MQKKHNFFLVLGVPTFGEGGATWLGQNPKFFQKVHLRAPLKRTKKYNKNLIVVDKWYWRCGRLLCAAAPIMMIKISLMQTENNLGRQRHCIDHPSHRPTLCWAIATSKKRWRGPRGKTWKFKSENSAQVSSTLYSVWFILHGCCCLQYLTL